jgi:cell shape-determining protein MreC
MKMRRANSRFGRRALHVGNGLILLGALYLLSAELRDGATLLQARSADALEYALVPRAVLIDRLSAREDELQRVRYQSILYETQAGALAALEKETLLRPSTAYGSARVVAVPPRTHYDTVLIAAGTEQGVRLGDIVTIEGIAVGQVTDVSDQSALAQLYSSPGAEHDAVIGSERAIVVTQGLGGGALETSVPGGVSIARGDAVVDPRTGLVFAYITEVVERDIDTSVLVRMTLPFAVNDLRYVSLIHPL